MSPCFESIALCKGVMPLLPFHQARVDRTCLSNGWEAFSLLEVIKHLHLPTDDRLYKLRISYDVCLRAVTCSPYQPKMHSEFALIPLVESYSYAYKYEDRQVLDESYGFGAEVGKIFTQEGRVTDASYANLVFWESGQGWTPKQPLLHGTQRTYLLSTGDIQEKEIKIEHLPSFSGFTLINALLPLDQQSKIYPMDLIKIK